MEEETRTCDFCGDVHPESEMHETYDGDTGCDDCTNECCRCGRIYANDDLITSNDGEWYCSSCYDNVFTTCRNCGEEVPLDDAYLDGDGRYYCESCWEERGDTNMIHDYGYKPEPIFQGRDGTRQRQLFLGTELEIECNNHNSEDVAERLVNKFDEDAKHFYLKYDGSLDTGFEIVSHPHTLEAHRKFAWKEAFTQLIADKCTSHKTDTCGMHIHFNRSFLRTSEQIRLGIFVHMNVKHLEILGRRENPSYAKFVDVKRDKGGYKYANINYDRYEALNYGNAKTIEFRFPKGTLKHSTYMATLEMVDSIVRFVKTCSTPQIVRDGWNQYLQFLNKNKKEYRTLFDYAETRGMNLCV